MITRLLVQKPAQYAELEENARIAVSVLQDDGWKIERIDDMYLTVTTTALFKSVDPCAGIQATLAEAEKSLVVLRSKIIQCAGDQWTAAGVGFFVSCFLVALGMGKWCAVFGALCVGAKVWHHRRYSKGVKV